MQRKPGFPVANCSIKMPDSGGAGGTEPADEEEQQQRRQQLINFGHAQWGFNNWSWSVTKQDLDFVDFASGKFCAGVVAFVSVSVKSLDIHRENIGYATALAPNKGFAVYKARKCAVTNGLKETLLSFGGNVATELMELLETHKTGNQSPAPIPPETLTENNQNIPNKVMEPKNSVKNLRKDSSESVCAVPANMRQPAAAVKPVPPVALPPPPARQPPAPRVPIHVPHVPPPPPHVPQAPPHVPQAPRPNSNLRPRCQLYNGVDSDVYTDLTKEPCVSKPLENMTEEEARAERKRRQKQAQEEFRLKQMMKQTSGNDDKQDLQKASASFDKLLMDIPTQDIVIEESCSSECTDTTKRKSPSSEAATKRRGSIMRLDIVTD